MNIARFRNITMAQASADAFAQTSEVTGIDPSSGRGWALRRAEIQFPQSAGLQGLSADSAIHWALTRDSKSSMSDLSDQDTIIAGGFFNALTTSGALALPSLHVHTFPDGIIVVEPTLYAHIDSVSTGLTMMVNMRLYYEEVKLSEVEILRMLTQG